MELQQHTHLVRAAQLPRVFFQRKLKTEILLGNPCTGCQGVGICRVMSYGQSKDCKCPTVTAWICATAHGKIRINFLKSSMDKPTIGKHFRWLLFQVYEAYNLPEGLAIALGHREITVQPGIYTVWETQRYLTVDF